MGKRMNWDRAKKRDTRDDPRGFLDREADRILGGGKFRRPNDRRQGGYEVIETREFVYFRAVGSVLLRAGRWHALDGNGNVVGDFSTRWEAWRAADKMGTERVTVGT